MPAQINYMLEQLAVLIESSVNNQAMLCRQRLIRVILVEFQNILTVGGMPSAPFILAVYAHPRSVPTVRHVLSPLQDAAAPIQAPLLNLVSLLGRYHMSTLELRCFLRLLRVRRDGSSSWFALYAVTDAYALLRGWGRLRVQHGHYPSNLLSTLHGISEHQHSHCYHPRHYLGTPQSCHRPCWSLMLTIAATGRALWARPVS